MSGFLIWVVAPIVFMVLCGIIVSSKSDKEADKRFYATLKMDVRLWKGQLRIIHAQNRIATALEKMAGSDQHTEEVGLKAGEPGVNHRARVEFSPGKNQVLRFFGVVRELVNHLELRCISDPDIAVRVSMVREEMRESAKMFKTPTEQQIEEIRKRTLAEVAGEPGGGV